MSNFASPGEADHMIWWIWSLVNTEVSRNVADEDNLSHQSKLCRKYPFFGIKFLNCVTRKMTFLINDGERIHLREGMSTNF